MFRDTFISNFIKLICSKLNTTKEVYGEDYIISSKFMKNKYVKSVANKYFISYNRDNKLKELLS